MGRRRKRYFGVGGMKNEQKGERRIKKRRNEE